MICSTTQLFQDVVEAFAKLQRIPAFLLRPENGLLKRKSTLLAEWKKQLKL